MNINNLSSLTIYYPEGHNEHYEQGHPERPERVERIVTALHSIGLWQAAFRVQPLQVPQDVLHSVHQPAYLDLLRMTSKRSGHLDADTYVVPASWSLALNSAGGACAVAKNVWTGETGRGFALTRPPGHHATRGQGMGFCLLNNIAIAAEFLVLHYSAKKLAIVDLDLHHGNGTQEIFWLRSDIFYFSTHQSPLYPGSGRITEQGGGTGFGYTANFPMPPGSGDQAFLHILEEVIVPLLQRYAPEMILVSYGFDPHWRDPLGSLLLSAEVYGQLIRRLTSWADEHCGGKIALFLEGGYDLEAATACSQAVVSALVGQPWKDPLGPAPYRESQEWNKMLKAANELWQV